MMKNKENNIIKSFDDEAHSDLIGNKKRSFLHNNLFTIHDRHCGKIHSKEETKADSTEINIDSCKSEDQEEILKISDELIRLLNISTSIGLSGKSLSQKQPNLN
jgi:hypothetical protein